MNNDNGDSALWCIGTISPLPEAVSSPPAARPNLNQLPVGVEKFRRAIFSL